MRIGNQIELSCRQEVVENKHCVCFESQNYIYNPSAFLRKIAALDFKVFFAREFYDLFQQKLNFLAKRDDGGFCKR